MKCIEFRQKSKINEIEELKKFYVSRIKFYSEAGIGWKVREATLKVGAIDEVLEVLRR